MSNVIKEYYEKTHILPVLIEQKLAKFQEHPDIMLEFEEWLCSKQYKSENAVSVMGYTAKSLSEMSPYLRGEGAFILLMELRDNPEKALRRIELGFKKK